MKKTLFSLSFIIFLGSGLSAQKDSSKRKEIIVEKKINDGKPEKTVIVIDGDKVTVNGEEVKDFNGKFNLRGNDNFNFQDFNEMHSPDAFEMLKKISPAMPGGLRGFNAIHGNKAMLGVATEKDKQGAKVTEVTEESSAAKAGIKTEDIITAINSDKITDGNDLVKAIGKYKPEEKVDITVLRSGKEKKLKATLGRNSSAFSGNMNWNMNEDAMPPLPPMPPMARLQNEDFHKFEGAKGLFDFAQNNDRPKFGFGIKDNENGEGAVVTNIKEEGAAAKAGLKENDIITDVAGNIVKNTDELKRLLADNRDKTEITVKVLRNGSAQTITLKVPKKIKTAEL